MTRAIDDIFDPEREKAELQEYLGDRFDIERIYHYQEQLDEEFAQIGDEQAFYRTSVGYLYNLTVFAMSATKLPYLRELTARLPPGSRLLDYGCGIGADGLLLLEAGYRVEFADFANPSTEYLRWRLAHRGLDAPVHDLAGTVPGGFDAAYAFDVIEHVEEPFAFLGEMEQRAKLVEVNFLEPEPDDQASHHELPIKALVRHAADHRLRHYAILHSRSHLVMYESTPGSWADRVAGRARILGGRLRRSSGDGTRR